MLFTYFNVLNATSSSSMSEGQKGAMALGGRVTTSPSLASSACSCNVPRYDVWQCQVRKVHVDVDNPNQFHGRVRVKNIGAHG
jgi:hypothetical protein